MPLAGSALAPFHHFPQADFGLSDADLQMGRFVYILEPCAPLPQTLLEFLLLPQLTQIFTSRGFESLVAHAETLDSVVCLASQWFFPAYRPTNVGPTGPAATSLAVRPLHLSCHLCPSY